MNLVDRLARKAVHGRLARIRHGRLLFEDEGTLHAFGSGEGPLARVRVKDRRFYRATALGGPVGAAEAFMRGEWACDDLPALIIAVVGQNGDRTDTTLTRVVVNPPRAEDAFTLRLEPDVRVIEDRRPGQEAPGGR